MGIFLDTGFYMALVDKNDPHYKKSLELLKTLKTGKYGQILTSILVISETLTLVSVRTKNNTKALNNVRELLVGRKRFALILRTNPEIEQKTMDLFVKRNSTAEDTMSYVDCSNIEFCKHNGLEYILSFDSHFDGWLKRIC
mgnify:CR=1 FL=1